MSALRSRRKQERPVAADYPAEGSVGRRYSPVASSFRGGRGIRTAGRLRERGQSVLSPGGRSVTASHEGIRGVLTISEIALALVLLTGAGLMLKSFLRLRSVNPGFQAENVLTMTVELPDTVYSTAQQVKDFHTRILQRLSSLPGVIA